MSLKPDFVLNTTAGPDAFKLTAFKNEFWVYPLNENEPWKPLGSRLHLNRMTNQITVELPEEFVTSLGKDAARELLIAAVLHWFAEGRLSQGQSAAMLGITRGDFFDLLHEHRVSPIQMSIKELDEDFSRA